MSTSLKNYKLLGMDLTIENDAVKLSQEKLINKGLEMLGMTECQSANTPLSVGAQLSEASKEELKKFQDLKVNYRTFTGILNYLSCRTRPYLAPAVSILSSFDNAPGINHWKEVLHVWKYLKGSKELKLTLQPSSASHNNGLEHYTGAIWVDNLNTCLSRSGSICFWKNCPIAWNSKKQKNITLSSTEAEMNALADSAQENQWIKFVAEELWNEELEPTTFKIDNQGLAEKIKHFGSNSKMKHLDIKAKWLRGLKKKNEIVVQLIPSEDMVADSLIKASSSALRRLNERCFSSFLIK
ncbi:hypothetical protein VP01_681g2 [Puccinia sorghi]|uniref:Reverse transcriptase Ty1/copia-type domain-containing protein n=1 Tax=Puccinia sorghi TaxID=27349 RepID=A0A0L6UEG5_9BASI|nr:hypothetical protein VP01_681g2 [Puccinia sorghi]